MEEYLEKNEEGKEQKVVEITPLTKGKRLLTFLGDFFLIFIISFALYNIAVNPIANAITSKDSRAQEALKANHARDEILYGNKVLFYESEATKYNISENLTYSFKRYISYYGFKEGEIYQKDPNIGHLQDNELFNHYYTDIRGNKQTYIDLLTSANAGYGCFEISGTNIALKSSLQNEVKLSFTSPDDMSEDGKTQYTNMQTIFLNVYQSMFNDIGKNDLTYNGNKFSQYQSVVTAYNNYYNNLCTIAAAITYFISFCVIYVVFPMINKNRRTPTMAILKIDRIGTNNMFIIKRGEVLINAVYALIFNAANLIFIPMTTIGFEGVFGLPYILVLSVIGLLLSFASMVSVILSSFNRGLTDYLSRSVMIKEEDLDQIYRARGYEI